MRPQNMTQWMTDVVQRLRRLEGRASTTVSAPIGSVILYVPAGTPDGNWLLTTGGSFSSATYPLLAAALGGTTLPNLTNPSGAHYIIRAR